MRHQFPPDRPMPFFGPEDYDGIGSIEQCIEYCDRRMEIWDKGYARLTGFQKLRLALGFDVYPGFEVRISGCPADYGIYDE